MDAEQGVEAVRIINPREAIPIHYNDYEVFKSPLEDFKRVIEEVPTGSFTSGLKRTVNKPKPAPGKREKKSAESAKRTTA